MTDECTQVRVIFRDLNGNEVTTVPGTVVGFLKSYLRVVRLHEGGDIVAHTRDLIPDTTTVH